MKHLMGVLLMSIFMAAPFAHADAPAERIANPHLRITAADTGRFTIDTTGVKHELLLQSATVAIALGGETISGLDPRFTRDIKRDSDGRMILRFTDQKKQANLESRITPLPDRAGAEIELIITNASPSDLAIPFAQPLRALAAESSCCAFGRYAKTDKKVLTNGYIYYDPGQLLDFPAGSSIKSRWNATFYDTASRRGLVVGFVENDRAEGLILVDRKGELSAVDNTFDLAARAEFHPDFVLQPGKSISTGRVLVLLSDRPHDALEYFADRAGKLHKVKLNPIINGWCTWFVYYGSGTEQNVIDHARFVALELKPYGAEWIQIDDGYQQSFGDWEGNDRFPHGMKWLADQIREAGLKPGLWIAPFAISATSAVAREHPEWLVHTASGELQKIVPEHQSQAQFILDITHPGAQEWMSNLFRTISHNWGYQFIKTDFVEWTILAAERFHDRTITRAAAYRLGNQIIRDAIGPDVHLLDCGPSNEIVGLLDSMRIGLDRPDGPGFDLWDQYAGHYNSAICAIAKRYYFHGRTWINDPDHLRLAKLSIAEGQAAATAIALSGGTTISGDDLTKLDPERLGILRKVLPSFGRAARPVDLFEHPLVELFVLPVHTDWSDWTLIADFNHGKTDRTKRIELSTLGLDPAKTYLAWDFWHEKLVGEVKGAIELSTAGRSVTFLVLREKLDVPQVLSTDRHVTQGGIELVDVRWYAPTKTLHGKALGRAPFTLFVHHPGGRIERVKINPGDFSIP